MYSVQSCLLHYNILHIIICTDINIVDIIAKNDRNVGYVQNLAHIKVKIFNKIALEYYKYFNIDAFTFTRMIWIYFYYFPKGIKSVALCH